MDWNVKSTSEECSRFVLRARATCGAIEESVFGPRLAADHTTMKRIAPMQISLRSLFVLITLIAIGPGWYVAREQRRAAQGNAMVSSLTQMGGRITYRTGECRTGWAQLILGDNSWESIRAVNLAGTHATDDHLRGMCNLTGVEELDLFHTNITDAGLSAISSWNALKRLDLSGTDTTSIGIAKLRRLQNLEYLVLNDTQVTDNGISHCAVFKRMNALGLNGTEVSDAGLCFLINLDQLKELGLSGTSTTDRGVSICGRFRKLEILNLSGTRVTNAGLKSVLSNNSIIALDVSNTGINSEGIMRIAGMRGLKFLFVDDEQAMVYDLEALRERSPQLSIVVY
jgi:hypothetical protein